MILSNLKSESVLVPTKRSLSWPDRIAWRYPIQFENSFADKCMDALDLVCISVDSSLVGSGYHY